MLEPSSFQKKFHQSKLCPKQSWLAHSITDHETMIHIWCALHQCNTSCTENHSGWPPTPRPIAITICMKSQSHRKKLPAQLVQRRNANVHADGGVASDRQLDAPSTLEAEERKERRAALQRSPIPLFECTPLTMLPSNFAESLTQ